MNEFTINQIKTERIQVIAHSKNEANRLATAVGYNGGMWNPCTSTFPIYIICFDGENHNNMPQWTASDSYFIKNYDIEKTIEFSQINFEEQIKYWIILKDVYYQDIKLQRGDTLHNLEYQKDIIEYFKSIEVLHNSEIFKPVYKPQDITLTLGNPLQQINIPLHHLNNLIKLAELYDKKYFVGKLDWAVTLNSFNIGCSEFKVSEIKQVIDKYNSLL